MERKRLKWYGHVMCMADDRIPRKMLEMKLRGRRPRGRPRTRWMDEVKREMEKRGKEWMQVIQDRDRWRFLCNSRPKRTGNDLRRKKKREDFTELSFYNKPQFCCV
jgi:hypothetical protein